MESAVEVQRREHEEMEKLELAMVEELLQSERVMPTAKARLAHELTASALLDQIQRTAQHLLTAYEDVDGARAADMQRLTISGDDTLGSFYGRLKEVKDSHRRHPMDKSLDEVEFASLVASARVSEEALDGLFSGEEAHGRFLDLLECHQRYLNLREVRALDYLQYLGEFDNWGAIPLTTKLTHPYARYLEALLEYFERFYRLAKPLFNYKEVMERERERFQADWLAGRVPEGWASLVAERATKESVYCVTCERSFATRSVYQAHLSGRKHQRAEREKQHGSTTDKKVDDNPRESNHSSSSQGRPVEGRMYHHDQQPAPSNQPQQSEVAKNSTTYKLALKEHLITISAELLGTVREETRANVERKQSRTFEEREEDLALAEGAEGLPSPVEATTITASMDDEGDEDNRIYNPLNLPLDWDGKPIPYWLWKLHGLGVRYPCEICGNHVYMGKRAFDQHFFEWRHAQGMRALGIPNTRHFYQVTRMEEAQALWERLRQRSRNEVFRPEAMEEFEDHEGNVYNRKTYEDLRRQGLL